MRHEHENARRHAYNTLAEVNRHLDRGDIKNPRHHQMLTDMAEKATRTLNNLDEMESRRPYSDTNIGYRSNERGRGRARSDTDDVVRNAMDAIDRILPQIADDRYDMDDERYDDMDDSRLVDMPRWRSARTGRFLPNLYGPRRVRRVRRRADMDDMRYDDDRYDDDRYDDRYDERRSRVDDDRRVNDAIARVAAETARRMADDARYTPPVMDSRSDRYDDRITNRDDARRYSRNDARNDNRTDARYDNRNDTNDDARRPGPNARD